MYKLTDPNIIYDRDINPDTIDLSISWYTSKVTQFRLNINFSSLCKLIDTDELVYKRHKGWYLFLASSIEEYRQQFDPNNVYTTESLCKKYNIEDYQCTYLRNNVFLDKEYCFKIRNKYYYTKQKIDDYFGGKLEFEDASYMSSNNYLTFSQFISLCNCSHMTGRQILNNVEYHKYKQNKYYKISSVRNLIFDYKRNEILMAVVKNNSNTYLSIEEIAKFYNVSVSTIQKWKQKGKIDLGIPFVKDYNKKIYYNKHGVKINDKSIK